MHGRHTAEPQNISCIVCRLRRREDHTTAIAIRIQGSTAGAPKKNERK